MQNTEPSLRERRRARTWDTIHSTALELAAERGVKQTTAELIAEQAGVSPRTFFNYFATKEDAVIGLRTPRMTPEMLHEVAQNASGNMISHAAQLQASVLWESFGGKAEERVRQVIRDNDDLRRRIKIHLLACEQELKDFLLEADWSVYRDEGRFVPREDSASQPDPEQEDRVRAIVLMATAVLRYVEYGVSASPEEFTDSINRTVSLFSTIVKEAH